MTAVSAGKCGRARAGAGVPAAAGGSGGAWTRAGAGAGAHTLAGARCHLLDAHCAPGAERGLACFRSVNLHAQPPPLSGQTHIVRGVSEAQSVGHLLKVL